MKMPGGKRVVDLTPEEREEAEHLIEAHIEAFEEIAHGLGRAIMAVQESISPHIRTNAPGVIPVAVALGHPIGALMAAQQNLAQHAAEDRRAWEESGLEGMERLNDERLHGAETDAKLQDGLGLGPIVKPTQGSEDPQEP